ncbi:hypothetical protein F7725_000142 [Dissostichus mawsoni]|uniref:NADP-dependent oxidoreductase domain-containing protein n=2 Tax=Dissostichus TaxID=36199 RepID=A0A7J5ZGW9_DISMA|nr:hypothetical protein F7725_000142 [Dissostichus mawsoni]
MLLLKVAEELMTLAYENGINLFDTAEVYSAGKAESVLGSIIKKKGWRLLCAAERLLCAAEKLLCAAERLLCAAERLLCAAERLLCAAERLLCAAERLLCAAERLLCAAEKLLCAAERLLCAAERLLCAAEKLLCAAERLLCAAEKLLCAAERLLCAAERLLCAAEKAEMERGLSRKHIIEGLRASLERLQLEYIDVVFANRPDPNTPIEETVRAMTHVINKGMAMYWGTSRWTSMEIMEAYSVARQFNQIPPICEQTEYHMFQREKVEVQLPELFHKIGIGAMTWSPLACGIISGKYNSGIPSYSRASLKLQDMGQVVGFVSNPFLSVDIEQLSAKMQEVFTLPMGVDMEIIEMQSDIELKARARDQDFWSLGYQWMKDKVLSEEGHRQQVKLKELQAVAERMGCTLPQLAIAWCLRNEGVNSVLLGASRTDQLMENIKAIQVLPKLSLSIVSEVDNLLGNKPYSKKDFRS